MRSDSLVNGAAHVGLFDWEYLNISAQLLTLSAVITIKFRLATRLVTINRWRRSGSTHIEF